MNIDKLTLGQIKQIQAMTGGGVSTNELAPELVGKYVIVRCRDAGVHAGYAVRGNGRSITLRQSRRLWKWVNVEDGISLSGIATHGLAGGSKVGDQVDLIQLTENCEILSTTDAAATSIRGWASNG